MKIMNDQGNGVFLSSHAFKPETLPLRLRSSLKQATLTDESFRNSLQLQQQYQQTSSKIDFFK